MKFLLPVCVFLAVFSQLCAASPLDSGFSNPPRHAGIRCWWWWLNSNVTKQAITRDLEAMHEKGFSGAMIFDAGGDAQRGNLPVPPGPLYGSAEWTELFLHALKEAKRLDLKLGLSIQSGWNLGGPQVTPDYAAKQLTWSETEVAGPGPVSVKLAQPNSRDSYYRDVCVLALPENEISKPAFKVNASSRQQGFGVENAVDGNSDTFWVSSGTRPGQGPTADGPEWIEFEFEEPVTVSGLLIRGRKDYGPKKCRIECPGSGHRTQVFELKKGLNELSFDPIDAGVFRIVITDARDPRYPDNPRNVQVADLLLKSKDAGIFGRTERPVPVRDLAAKSGARELGMSAPDSRFLLESENIPGEPTIDPDRILDISDRMNADGTLNWNAPSGGWTVMRFGYTITGAHVSTSSGEWKGRVIDYLSTSAFNRYWDEVVDPLLSKAGPMCGTVLTHLETDSWECGGMNWSPDFAADFRKLRGYDPIPWLPVIAGKIVRDRNSSNAFLADLRKTIAQAVSQNHYRVFAERAADYGLAIQPECSGPHAAPIDGITNYRHSDFVMSEFWVPSPHRPTPRQRFFCKQASSAAHIYGKKIVVAESFTSIGPHWDDVLWKSQKPSMDHEFCSGLNMLFLHTFTCSPMEMGIPGQEYFAGTHINPQVTWWDYSGQFIDYMARIQFLTQQGDFQADVLYYYGDHVPNIFPLKEYDPAGAMPGYDYDVTNEEVLLKLEVVDGRIVVPGRMRYRMLALPDHKVLSLAALEKVDQLLRQGATVVGPKPERLVSLVGGEKARKRFHQLADQLWPDSPQPQGQAKIGAGRLIWGKSARDILSADGVAADLEAINSEASQYDYIHYKIGGSDFYFLCNQTQQPQQVDCAFRVSGRQPELWNPVTGEIRTASAFTQDNGRTVVPLVFDPYGSIFVVFRTPIPPDKQGGAQSNFPSLQTMQQLDGPWRVSFDPQWGGPDSVAFEKLTDWASHEDLGIRYYSGKAVYEKSFDVPECEPGAPYWLELNKVEDTGIAAVRLNGRDFGTLWTKPWRVEITGSLKKSGNQLEITVVNSWRNRLVGDRDKPQDQRYTRTNITIRKDWKLLESGLLGPVEIRTVSQ